MKSALRHPLSPSWQEAVLLSLCAAILAWQLLLPGFIGMANNNDFAKVAGPLSLEGVDHGADNFVFFQSDYLRGPRHYFNPRIPSSEIPLAWLASSVQQMLADPVRFDIRWLGAIHGLLFLGFYYTVLLVLRPLGTLPRIILSLAALWIFADAGLIAYFNSFYTDTAAILGALIATMLAVYLSSSDQIDLRLLMLFGLAALLFITSKSQHGIWGFVPAALLTALVWRKPRRSVRLAGFAVAFVLLFATIWIVSETHDWDKAMARFDLIFFSLAPNSRTPAQDLRELGLNGADLRYVGMHSFMEKSPINDANWRTSFYSRSTYGRVVEFYLHHPGRAVWKLKSDLWNEAWQRRPVNLSNYRRTDGQPAGARTQRFGSWSAHRTWLFHWWPGHIVVWFACMLVLAPFLATREQSPFRQSLLWMLLALTLLAVGEFCFASLTDACETYRHLLMFHLFTDLTFFVVLVFAASKVESLFSTRVAARATAPIEMNPSLPVTER
jgi:hypothetical protein